MMKKYLFLPMVVATLGAGGLHAHSGQGHGSESAHAMAGSGEATPFGRAGDRKKATRTVRLSMDDRMRFHPAVVTVKKDETIRFVVSNRGKLLHEMVLGTDEELRRHAELMRKFPGMEHDSPHMVHVKPGATGDVVWTFDKEGEFAFACLVAGHFEAGMTGKVVVR
jgi:uncharacterized cupredoxin-like copper-binding protein